MPVALPGLAADRGGGGAAGLAGRSLARADIEAGLAGLSRDRGGGAGVLRSGRGPLSPALCINISVGVLGRAVITPPADGVRGAGERKRGATADGGTGDMAGDEDGEELTCVIAGDEVAE